MALRYDPPNDAAISQAKFAQTHRYRSNNENYSQ